MPSCGRRRLALLAMKNRRQLHAEFAVRFMAMQEEAAQTGLNLNKYVEWQGFIVREIHEGRAPRELRYAPPPRDLQAALDSQRPDASAETQPA